MVELRETAPESSWLREPRRDLKGLLLVSSAAATDVRFIVTGEDPVVIGRSLPDGHALPDERVSRAHSEVRFDGAKWHVRDLGSRNGTFVDGAQVVDLESFAAPRVLRVGHSLFCFIRDESHWDGVGVTVDEGVVVGPVLRRVLSRVRAAAQSSDGLLVTGESGTGKELAARAFHAASPYASGPLVAVNCAAIPQGVAERLLFGARRGTYSGADADADGYFQAADGGVLFLDEVAELDLAVQAKLLRAIQTREVVPLGASKPRKLRTAIVCATHQPLRAKVDAGTFRADLLFRIAQAQEEIPPLRERPEEVPSLVAEALRGVSAGLRPHARLAEACMLHPWPGNTRELWGVVRRAAQEAFREGEGVVYPRHAPELASAPVATSVAPSVPPPGPPSTFPPEASSPFPPRDAIDEALRRNGGNISAAARDLGMHRTQLYRAMRNLGLK